MTRSITLGRRSSSLWLLGDAPTRARLILQASRVARRYRVDIEIRLDDGRVVHTAPARAKTIPQWAVAS